MIAKLQPANHDKALEQLLYYKVCRLGNCKKFDLVLLLHLLDVGCGYLQ